MENNFSKKITILLWLVAILFIIVFGMGVYIFTNLTGRNIAIDELTVKKISIVDEKDNLRMVISNEHRQHNGIVDGIEFEPRERQSGMVFFNSAGDECGGLVYDGNEKSAGLVLSVDQFRNDQIMQMQYMEDTQTKQRKYGLQLWDYPSEHTFSQKHNRIEKMMEIKDPEELKIAYEELRSEGLIAEDRLFAGKNFNKEVGLFIRDSEGRIRIRIYVDENDNPRIEVLDKDGVSEVIK